MAALSTLFPVFFMIGLGALARMKKWITPEQKEGANHIVFNILFPIMIFNVLLTAKIESSVIWIILYVFIAFILTMVIGKLLSGLTGKKFAHISLHFRPPLSVGHKHFIKIISLQSFL